jgi:hypothetical protein
MATGHVEQPPFRRMDADLWFMVDGLLRGAVVGAAVSAGLWFILDGLLQGPVVGGAAGTGFILILPTFLMATFVGAVLGAASGGVLGLAGYGRRRWWLPVIGGVVGSGAWLLYGHGLELLPRSPLFLRALPIAAAAGVLLGIWLMTLDPRSAGAKVAPMVPEPLEVAAFRRRGARLWFTVNGLVRGLVVGSAPGMALALALGVNEQRWLTATSVGGVVGAVAGGLIALAGYGRPKRLPALGAVVASYGWLAWSWLLYSRGQSWVDWAGLFLLVLPFAAAAGVLQGIWLRKLRMRARSTVTHSGTD